MPKFETRLWSNDPRYRMSNGAVAVYVFDTEKAAQDKANKVTEGWKGAPFPMTATVHETTFDLVCTVEDSAFSTGVRVYLRAPSTLSERSAMARMTHAARKRLGGPVMRVSGPGASVSEKGLVTTWQAFYNYRRES
jgi:hypothetical protein